MKIHIKSNVVSDRIVVLRKSNSLVQEKQMRRRRKGGREAVQTARRTRGVENLAENKVTEEPKKALEAQRGF